MNRFFRATIDKRVELKRNTKERGEGIYSLKIKKEGKREREKKGKEKEGIICIA